MIQTCRRAALTNFRIVRPPRFVLCSSILAAATAAVLPAGHALAQAGAASRVSSATPATSQPRDLVLDQTAVWQNSRVGQDITRQGEALAEAARKEFGPALAALQKEGQELEKETANLPPNVRQDRTLAFRTRNAKFRRSVGERQGMIDAGVTRAQEQVEKRALFPILRDIMKTQGATVVFDKSSVLKSLGNIDITEMVLRRLDAAPLRVTVRLTKPPSD